MADLCNLQIHVNGQQTFFLNQNILSAYSGSLKKLIKQEKKKMTTEIEKISITLEEFPGGADGFEQISRFCYNNGRIPITISNVSALYCAAVYLGMTDKMSIKGGNLMEQSENFLEGMFYWSWGDVLVCLKTCEPFFSYSDSCGLIDKLITTLLAKIAQNSDISLLCSSNSSSSSSPSSATKGISSSNNNSFNHNNNNSNNKAWWFDDLCVLSPMMIEKVLRNLGAFGSENNSLLLTKFLVHYLKKSTSQCKKNDGFDNYYSKSDYSGLADTAVYGVVLMGNTGFSCRALFWVLRLVSGLGLSKVCRTGLEKLIGSMLDLAKLDDLLVSSIDGDGGVYDVNLVVRLIRVFVQCEGVSLPRLKKVGWLIDQYLAEISPDHNLKISKFMGVAQSLPDLARDCFDGVYRAIDIYLESHPSLSFEERSRLCRCLNYEKLSLEACKDLAKNPRIPPRVAVQALASQKHYSNYEPPTKTEQLEYYSPKNNRRRSNKQIVVYKKGSPLPHHDHRHHDRDVDHYDHEDDEDEYHYHCHGRDLDHEEDEEEEESSNVSGAGSEDMKLNIQRMQWRVLELEKMCKEMKGQMTRLVRHNNKSFSSPAHNNRPPRLC